MHTILEDGRQIRVHHYGGRNYGWSIMRWAEEIGVWVIVDERAGYKSDLDALTSGIEAAREGDR